jgi:hypothetical protein
VTLNRLLRGDAGLAEARRAKLFEVQRDIARAAFMSVLRRHPGAGIKQVRSFPGNRYSWLYRHDRSWLLEQSRQLLERR